MQKQNFYVNAYMLLLIHYGIFLGIPQKTCNTLKRTIRVSAYYTTIIIYHNHGYGLRFKRHFQQYFSYIVSFISGENRCIRRQPPICRKSLTNFISHNFALSTLRHEQYSNSQR